MNRGSSDESNIEDHPYSSDDLVAVDANVEADDLEDARAFAKLGVWAVPVAIVHLFLLYALLRAITGFRLPTFLHADAVVAWLWVNGAAVALGIWLWRTGRVPARPGTWVRGPRAKQLIVAWLGLSLAWFMLPVFLREVAQLLSSDHW
jgi:hypothetical protein